MSFGDGKSGGVGVDEGLRMSFNVFFVHVLKYLWSSFK